MKRINMLMMLLLALYALCSMAMAQTFHGVSVTGAMEGPTITNDAANPPVLGLVLLKMTANGINRPYDFMDGRKIALGKPTVAPGESASYNMMGVFGRRVLVKDPDTGVFHSVSEGDITGYQVMAVVFADGTFYGPDDPAASDATFKQMSASLSEMRSLARDAQYMPSPAERYSVLERRRSARVAPVNPNASRPGEVGSARQMAAALLEIRDTQGDDAAAAAIARIAALPDVVKGE